MMLHTMRKTVVAAMIFGSLLSTLNPGLFFQQGEAIAQVNSPRRRLQNPRPQNPMVLLTKELNLSPKQLEQVKHIHHESQAKIKQQLISLQNTQMQLSSMMAGTTSRGQVRIKYNQLNYIKQQLADAQFDSILEFREILNPAQRRKFVELMTHRR